jgi:branched-chain amino acid transport system ATP-binding protein
MRRIDKRFTGVHALRQVDFDLEEGEIHALVGENGAGKSTLMKVLMGFVAPAGGEIRFDGRSLRDAAAFTRARLGIGYAPEGRRVFPGMTVRENLEVGSREGGAARRRLIQEVFAMFPALEARQGALGWQLSGGQQQMLAIGRALMTRPRLLLLDEPSLGLSPVLMTEVLDRVRAIVARGTAVLLAEQNVSKALEVADRAYVLQVGSVVREGDAAELRRDPSIREAFLGG